MTEPTLISYAELADTALIVTTVNGNSGLPEVVKRRSTEIGCTPPPIIVVDHPHHFQTITVDDLRSTGLIAVLVPDDLTEQEQAGIGRLEELISQHCERLGIRPAPLMLTTTVQGGIEQWATNTEKAAVIIGHLRERFGL